MPIKHNGKIEKCCTPLPFNDVQIPNFVGVDVAVDVSTNDDPCPSGSPTYGVPYDFINLTAADVTGALPTVTVNPTTEGYWCFKYDVFCDYDGRTVQMGTAKVVGFAQPITANAEDDVTTPVFQGVATSVDVSVNDDTACTDGGAVGYGSIINYTGVTAADVTGTLPNLVIDTAFVGNWSIEYEITCVINGVATVVDTAIVSGVSLPITADAVDDPNNDGPTGTAQNIDISTNDIACSDGGSLSFSAPYNFSNIVAADITGTAPNLVVTPSLVGAWSFDYDILCTINGVAQVMDTATVSGEATAPPPESRVTTPAANPAWNNSNVNPATGTVDVTITNIGCGTAAIAAGECARIVVEVSTDQTTWTTYETLTGLVNDPASSWTTDNATAANSVLANVAGTAILSPAAAAGGTWAFDKEQWSSDNGFECDPCYYVRFNSYVGGTCAGNAAPTCPVESTNTDNFADVLQQVVAGRGAYYDADFDSNDNLVWADYNNGAGMLRIMDTDSYCTKSIGTVTGGIAFALGISADTSTSGDDRIWGMDLTANGPVYYDNATRLDNGGTGVPTTVTVNATFDGLNVYADNTSLTNGRSKVWAMGNAVGNHLALLEWDGTSAYTVTDFSSVVNALTLGNIQGISDMQIDSNGVIWLLAAATGFSNVVIRLEQTTAGAYNNPANWTADYVMSWTGTTVLAESTPFADVDGAGNVTRTRRIATFDIYGYDGTIGAGSGTDPMFLIANLQNDSLKVLQLTGTDQTDATDWTLSTPAAFGGLNNNTNTDTVGAAPNNFNGPVFAQWNNARDTIFIGSWNNPNVSNTHRPISTMTDPEGVGQDRQYVFGTLPLGFVDQKCY